jgi:ribonuclease HII
MILGIDEVGRGPWAGPLVVGAVVLGGAEIEGLTDRKKLTKKRRDELDVVIRDQALGWGLGWVHAHEIDEIGLGEALRLATRRAVEQVRTSYHEIIIDGTINFLAETTKGQYVTCLKKADLLVPSVSAASIIAKVARDNYMAEQDELFEGYAFGSHVGYGTAAHRQAIDERGVTPLHRLSFAPLAKYRVEQSVDEVVEKNNVMTTKRIGDAAEQLVAEMLERDGHEIIERNWRTRFCEVDIISKKDDTLYFVEVKYRKTHEHGDGFAAITAKKQQQMTFAAKLYLASRRELSAQLVAVAVSGTPPRIDETVYII